MKKFAWMLLLASLSLSLNCHAEQVPIVIMDHPSCHVKGWHNLGGCFKNMTGADITDDSLSFRQSIYYSDKRTKIVGVFALGKFHTEQYVVTSTSNDVLKNHHIKYVVNEMITGKSTQGGAITGCTFELSEGKPLARFSIVKSGNTLSCRPE